MGRPSSRSAAIGSASTRSRDGFGREPLRRRRAAERRLRLACRGAPARDELLERHPRIDVLVNNAGLVGGQSHAHRGRLRADLRRQSPGAVPAHRTCCSSGCAHRRPARVVTTSSGAHNGGVARPRRPPAERSWSSWSAYSNSKLANVLFTRALAAATGGHRRRRKLPAPRRDPHPSRAWRGASDPARMAGREHVLHEPRNRCVDDRPPRQRGRDRRRVRAPTSSTRVRVPERPGAGRRARRELWEASEG